MVLGSFGHDCIPPPGVGVGGAGALFDGLDGIMARESGRESRFGAVLDSTCDRITEILVLLGILSYYQITGGPNRIASILACVAVTGSLMVSYVKARAEGAGLTCSTGLLQRPERLLVLGGFLLAGDRAMVWGLGIVSFLTYATVLQRLRAIAKAARR